MVTADDIWTFWFTDTPRARWFNATDAFDADIRQRFESAAIGLSAALDTAKPHIWETEGQKAHLSLILALDQFPRNMYRDTPAAFAWDAKALAVTKRLLHSGGDLRLDQTARPFAYMPFMHSENLADQTRCVELCDARLEDAGTLKFAIIHRDIIAQFGRFPHRNKILGRDTTPAEQSFLDNGGFSG